MNNKLIPIAIIIAGLIIGGAVIFVNYQKCEKAGIDQGEIISSKEAGEKVVDFINKNLLQGRAEASLIETLEENGFYKIKFEVEEQEVEWQITRDGRFLFPEVIDLTEIKDMVEETDTTVGNFSVSSDQVCKEDDKPIIYFFGSERCPHCTWEHPIIREVAEKFGGLISFHDNMDSDADMDVFQRYSTGSVPSIVLGCKYYRVGSGESLGMEEETEALTTLICELTNNQPSEVCQE